MEALNVAESRSKTSNAIKQTDFDLDVSFLLKLDYFS